MQSRDSEREKGTRGRSEPKTNSERKQILKYAVGPKDYHNHLILQRFGKISGDKSQDRKTTNNWLSHYYLPQNEGDDNSTQIKQMLEKYHNNYSQALVYAKDIHSARKMYQGLKEVNKQAILIIRKTADIKLQQYKCIITSLQPTDLFRSSMMDFEGINLIINQKLPSKQNYKIRMQRSTELDQNARGVMLNLIKSNLKLTYKTLNIEQQIKPIQFYLSIKIQLLTPQTKLQNVFYSKNQQYFFKHQNANYADDSKAKQNGSQQDETFVEVVSKQQKPTLNKQDINLIQLTNLNKQAIQQKISKQDKLSNEKDNRYSQKTQLIAKRQQNWLKTEKNKKEHQQQQQQIQDLIKQKYINSNLQDSIIKRVSEIQAKQTTVLQQKMDLILRLVNSKPEYEKQMNQLKQKLEETIKQNQQLKQKIQKMEDQKQEKKQKKTQKQQIVKEYERKIQQMEKNSSYLKTLQKQQLAEKQELVRKISQLQSAIKEKQHEKARNSRYSPSVDKTKQTKPQRVTSNANQSLHQSEQIGKFVSSLNKTIQNSLKVNFQINLHNYRQNLPQLSALFDVLKNKISFLSQSRLYQQLDAQRKSFLLQSIKGIVNQDIENTKKLFEGTNETSFVGWLNMIERKKNLLVLLELQNGHLICGFSEDEFQMQSKESKRYGDGFLMSLTNLKRYELKTSKRGCAIKNDLYMLGFGNNELLIKLNLTFSVIFRSLHSFFETKKDKISDFIGQDQQEGRFKRIQIHQCFVRQHLKN